MIDYLSRAGKTILIIVIVVGSVAYVKNLADSRKPIVKIIRVPDPNHIPSAREIQQRLKDTGKERYNPGKIDGIIGVQTKSQTAWDNYTCDQFAKRAITGESK
jgi:hypothetical protein